MLSFDRRWNKDEKIMKYIFKEVHCSSNISRNIPVVGIPSARLGSFSNNHRQNIGLSIRVIEEHLRPSLYNWWPVFKFCSVCVPHLEVSHVGPRGREMSAISPLKLILKGGWYHHCSFTIGRNLKQSAVFFSFLDLELKSSG